MPKTFDDSKYFEKVFDSNKIDKTTYKKMKSAFKLAHDVRKFEIELFWKRGTYFWAFILGSFTAYFVTFDKILGKQRFCYSSLMAFSPLAKIVLLILACLIFIFCLSWVFVNKGSKFWQKNWEAHIDVMEDIFSGKIYKTILNTKTDVFSDKAWKKDAYDYSVTKITTVSSIILMTLSFCLSIFHAILFFTSFFNDSWFHELNGIVLLSIGIFIILCFFYASLKLSECKGNLDESKKEEKWRQRS